jgi:DNA polymerase I-like protein with 3'-5' exonuclease and polymerase domains
MKLALGEMHDVETAYRDQGAYCEPLLTVHDELVQEVDEDVAEELAKETRAVFAASCPLRVPVDADSKVMDRWRK